MKLRREKWRATRALYLIGIILSAAALVLVGVYLWSQYGPQRTAVAPQPEVAMQEPPRPVSASSNALFFGNAYWGRYINDWSMASDLKTAYPFSRLSEFERNKYDAWIAGLECPTVAGLSLTSAEEDETLSFNCNPDYLPEAAKWFTAFTLANNHTDNQGVEGFAETKQHLEENGIQYFGHYDPDEVADVCEVIAFPVTVAYDDDSIEKQFLPVALCGYHAVFKLPSEESLRQITAYAEIMPVIALPHMGKEYMAAPDELKTEYYRAMIDNGADIVLGDHPHWVQATEAYKGKLIVYSMGNFMFDQQDTMEVTRSAAINVVINTTASGDELTDWLEIGSKCKSFHDTCAALATDKNLQKLSFEYAFGVVGTDDSQKIVKPATEEQQTALLQRLNWSQTMSQLQLPQKSL